MSVIGRVLILSCSVFVCSASLAREKYSYARTQRVELNVRDLARCMAGQVQLHGGKKGTLEPRTLYSNNYHNRSPVYAENCAYSDSDFYDYLLAVSDRECDYATGQERDLGDFVMKQPDNSIDPLKIFAESLRLNDGHVFDSILTIHQLLRNEARWKQAAHYTYSSSDARDNTFWNKFVDIRGDLAQRGPGFVGDHRGSWYRLWGIMIYRLSMAKLRTTLDTPGSCREVRTGTFVRLRDAAISAMTASGAELIKYAFDFIGGDYKPGGDRQGKIRINLAGSSLGGQLASDLEDGQILDPASPRCASARLIE